MTVWTIDAEPGIDGRRIGLDLAEWFDVPVVDGDLATDTTMSNALDFEHAVSRRLVRAGLVVGLAYRTGPELVRELERLDCCRSALELAATSAARESCVIVGRCAFMALGEHPGAVHARIRAPSEWRARRHAVEQCIPLPRARHAITRADRRRRTALRAMYGRALDDVTPFHLVCDASRVSHEAVVELLAALVPTRRPAHLAGVTGDA